MIGVLKRSGYALAALALLLSLGMIDARRAHADTSYLGTVFNLAGDDELSEDQVPIGFNFDFYGQTQTQGYVSTNGSLQFGPDTTNSTSSDIPNGDLGPFISPFWNDLYTNGYEDHSIYYKTIGDPGSRIFILQWTNMNQCCSNNAIFGNFQILLYEGSNNIRFQYFGLTGSDFSKGGNATIGLQKDGTTYNRFSQGEVSLDAPTDAIEFTPDGDGGYTDNGHKVAYTEMVLYTDELPPKPELNAPVDEATGVSATTPLFTWKPVEGATHYIVAWSSDPNMEETDSSPYGEGDALTNFSYAPDTTLTPGTVYYWRVGAFKDGKYSFSDKHSFTTSSADPSDSPPVLSDLGPSDMISGDTLDPTKLLSTPFTFSITDSDESQKVGYEFIISTSTDPGDAVIDCLSPVGDQGDQHYTYGHTTGGTYLRGSNSTHLEDGTTYHVFARPFDEVGGGNNLTGTEPNFVYSGTPADDSDGTTSTVEDAAPNSGDANNDGFPDSWEANVSNIVDPVTDHYAVLQTDGLNPGDCSNQGMEVKSEAAEGTNDPLFDYPMGLMHFTVHCATPGASVKITQIFYGHYPGTYGIRKYNPTTHTYSNIPGAQFGFDTIGGQPVMKAVYFVTDGGPLDEDGTANGTIVDPAGIGLVAAAVSAPNTGLKTISPLPFLSSIGLGVALTIANRRSRKD